MQLSIEQLNSELQTKLILIQTPCNGELKYAMITRNLAYIEKHDPVIFDPELKKKMNLSQPYNDLNLLGAFDIWRKQTCYIFHENTKLIEVYEEAKFDDYLPITDSEFSVIGVRYLQDSMEKTAFVTRNNFIIGKIMMVDNNAYGDILGQSRDTYFNIQTKQLIVIPDITQAYYITSLASELAMIPVLNIVSFDMNSTKISAPSTKFKDKPVKSSYSEEEPDDLILDENGEVFVEDDDYEEELQEDEIHE